MCTYRTADLCRLTTGAGGTKAKVQLRVAATATSTRAVFMGWRGGRSTTGEATDPVVGEAEGGEEGGGKQVRQRDIQGFQSLNRVH